MINRTVRHAVIGAFVTLMAMPAALADGPIVIKMATLAPKNSPWGQVFLRAARELEKESQGRVKIKLYAGGSRGDEKVMVRKMKSGQLDGVAVTSVGLAQIAQEILVLQTPGLITSNKQMDCVRDKLGPRFEKTLLDKGFVLLGWGDVGKTYLMGGVEVRNPTDLRNVKPWVWEADPVFGMLYKQIGANATPLTVPDVLHGLSNNVIDTIYSSPVATVSLQWHPHVKFINSKLINIGIGATLISVKAWNKATPEDRETIARINHKWHKILQSKVRKMNTKALKTLKERGAKVVSGDSAKWNALFVKVQDALVGKIYSKALLEETRKYAAACKK